MRAIAYAVAALTCSTLALAVLLAAARLGTRSERPRRPGPPVNRTGELFAIPRPDTED